MRGSTGFPNVIHKLHGSRFFEVENRDDLTSGKSWLLDGVGIFTDGESGIGDWGQALRELLIALHKVGPIQNLEQACEKESCWDSEIRGTRAAILSESNRPEKIAADTTKLLLAELSLITESIQTLAAFRKRVFERPDLALFGFLGIRISCALTVEQSPFAFMFYVPKRYVNLVEEAHEFSVRNPQGLTSYSPKLPCELRGRILLRAGI